MYIYYNSSFQRNQEPPRNFPGEYSTDLVSDRSVSFLQHAADAKKPFFLTVAPIGPHTENIFPSQPGTAPLFNPPVPADRHKGLYKDARVPRTANFNPSQVSMTFDIMPVLTSLDQWGRLLSRIATVERLSHRLLRRVLSSATEVLGSSR